MKKLIALSFLTLCLTTSQAHAGKIKKTLLGVTLVGIGVGATILYKKGQEDTSAFTFAEMGDKKTALEIYQYRIFPMLMEQDDASISKYERHYAILQHCIPRSCMKELYGIN